MRQILGDESSDLTLFGLEQEHWPEASRYIEPKSRRIARVAGRMALGLLAAASITTVAASIYYLNGYERPSALTLNANKQIGRLVDLSMYYETEAPRIRSVTAVGRPIQTDLGTSRSPLIRNPIGMEVDGSDYVVSKDSWGELVFWDILRDVEYFCVNEGESPAVEPVVLGYNTLTSGFANKDTAVYYGGGFPSSEHEEKWCSLKVSKEAIALLIPPATVSLNQ
jgi:hypothetical protein